MSKSVISEGKTTQEAIEKGLVRSAHDLSEGGLAVALAECCITNPKKKIGAVINLGAGKIRKDALLFGESQSRVILSAKKSNVKNILQIARKNKTPVSAIGKTGGDRLIIEGLINQPLTLLYKSWNKALESCL